MRNWSENQIKLILIRHGTTEANKEHRYLGRTNQGLSAEGMEKLQKLRDEGCYPDIDYLFSSPMKRCLETARILYPDKKITVIPDWIEMDFGAFEGKNYIDLQGDERYQAWIDSNGTLPFPEGESREEFIARCRHGFDNMLEKLREQCSEFICTKTKKAITVCLVVHGGTIMSLLSSFCGGDYFDYQVDNGKGYICEIPYRCILSGVPSGFVVRGPILLPASDSMDWKLDNETGKSVIGEAGEAR